MSRSKRLRMSIHFSASTLWACSRPSGEDGKPWGAAIYYVADEDLNFYFVTRAETFKYQNLNANPVAALTIADETDQATVQVSGTISELPAEDYMDIVFTKLAAIRPKDDPHWRRRCPNSRPATICRYNSRPTECSTRTTSTANPISTPTI